jgi:aminopeptidase N
MITREGSVARPLTAAMLLMAGMGWLASCTAEDAGGTQGGSETPSKFELQAQPTDGSLSPAQAAYDVLHYDLALAVNPEQREISGALTVRLRALEPLPALLLDLDSRLEVQAATGHAIVEGGDAVAVGSETGEFEFEQGDGRVLIQLPGTLAAGTEYAATIYYSGVPRVAPNPPWEGGFQWERTLRGEHWIATSCQMEGADLWWPCKDHPSDKPDGFDLHIRVPQPLVVASNGRLQKVEQHDDQTRTYHWKLEQPIPNYTVALNIGPYEVVEDTFESVSGDTMPVKFWLLPENVEKGREILPEFMEHLRFFEKHLGPYPFRSEKYGIADTPHLGMEHMTIIAYGNKFQEFKWGFDWLHHHEAAHEWFANLVTAPNWNDFWIHEGFGSYVQKLYVEEKKGSDAYRGYLRDVRGLILNQRAVAPRESRSSPQMFFVDLNQPVGQRVSDSDIYYKGEWVLHTLRWLIGKDALLRTLRKMCYPDAAAEAATDGSAVHFFTTDDYLALVEAETGEDLDWFFELYLRQPTLPLLVAEHEEGTLSLHWEVPEGLTCKLPVEIVVGGVPQRVEMPNGSAEIQVPSGVPVDIDPFDRILRVGNTGAR